MEPLVSVCIPTFNGGKYIRETLDSLYNQFYPNIELIVSDDDSKDDTLDIIRDTVSVWDIPVKIINHRPNGIGANWNNCVRNAQGEYIKFLFQDDIIYPNCISEMVELAERDQEIGIVFSNRKIIGDIVKNETWMEKYANLSEHLGNLKKIQSGRSFLGSNQILKSPLNKFGEPTVVLLRRDIFNKVGFFSEKLKQSLDIEYWYRLLPFYKVGFVDKQLVAFRLHSEQASQINKKENFHQEMYLFHKSLAIKLIWYLPFRQTIKLLIRTIQYFVRSKFMAYSTKA